jgi:lipopolysaccharide biosynthesis glycosyltransferase
MDMGSNKYVGVIDVEGVRTSRLDSEFKMDYINSGVLLINLEALRNDNSFGKMLDIYKSNKEKFLWVDQCLINMYAFADKIVLDAKYNCMVRADAVDSIEWVKLKNSGLIYHFIGAVKPWHMYCREHIFDFWWSYAKLLNTHDLIPVRPRTIKELLLQCDALEEYGKFQKSLEIKNGIINILIDKIQN